MSMTGTGSLSMDPRGRRLARLFASGVLDMQEEKFGLLNIAPTSPYDLYHRILRAQPASVRQIGVPLDEETREIEIGTDEIVMCDKEVQFCYGDDTALLNTMRAIETKREAQKKGESVSETVRAEAKGLAGPTIANGPSSLAGVSTSTAGGGGGAGAVSTGGNEAEESSPGSSTRLTSFLQRASQLCETLLEETRQRREEEQSKLSGSRTENFKTM